jgi:hypothetical protein
MLTVTKPALARLSRMLTRKGANDDMALRFIRRKGGWMLRLDREAAEDTAITHDGRKVLLLDRAVSKAMVNMTLDARRSGERSRLKLLRNQLLG